MNARPLVLVIEDAKNVLMNTVVNVKEQTGLPSSIPVSYTHLTLPTIA